MKYCFTIILLFVTTALIAQKIPLINSGEVIEKSRQLTDSSKYEEAINLLLTVPQRDTNYVYMLSELAAVYTYADKHDEAIATANRVLQKPTTYESSMLRIRAVSTARKGDLEGSISLFKEAIKSRPFDVSIKYSLGTIYFDNARYEEAADCFFQVLAINPFHAGAHLNLGRVAIRSGRKTHGMFSLGMYLSVNNTDNTRLVLLNNFVSNQVTDENTISVKIPNGCEKLDQIIKSRIALDKNFTTKVDFEAAVVNQFEMLFQQLETIKTNIQDPWVRHYLPIYKNLNQEKMVEPFIYFLLKSTGKDDVKKWISKNEKIMSAFYQSANTALKKDRQLVDATGAYGFQGMVQAWYNDNNVLGAIGKTENDQNVGRWIYLGNAGHLKAEGNFENGKKTGTWKYYYETGELRNMENYETGEITLFRIDGSKQERYFLKNQLTEGDVEIFYPSGPLEEKTPYKADKRHGKGIAYFISGATKTTYEYVDGKANGDWTYYYESGQISNAKHFKDDYLDGLYQEFYPNGKLKKKGTYVEGVANGNWKYYYSNGKIEKEGDYKNDELIGVWTYYNASGQVSNIVHYNDKGERDGVSSDYYDGKPYNFYTYKNDKVIKIVYVDWNGKEVGSFGHASGNFNAKIYLPTGQLKGEGSYKNGKVDGTWTYYNPEGTKLSVYSYKEGVTLEGAEFHRNGKKRFVFPYQNGQLHGYLIEYDIYGNVVQEGWYQNGLRQQQWLTYSSSGALETDYYYLNNELFNYCWEFNTDGKKYFSTKYKNGDIELLEQYDSQGLLTSKQKIKNGVTIYETNFSNGRLHSQLQVAAGKYYGDVTYWYPDGSIQYQFKNENGERHGPVKEYFVNGQVSQEGVYMNGNPEGIYRSYYPNGKTDVETCYISGSRDSVATFYFPFGGLYYTAAYVQGARFGITHSNSPEGTPMIEKLYIEDDLAAFRVVQSDNHFGEWQLLKPNSSIIAKYPNGIVAYEETFKNGLQDGIKRINFKSGKPFLEYNFKDGNLEGEYKIYYPDGTLFEKRNYVKDQADGQLEFYNEDGTLLLTETYVGGMRNGRSVHYKKGLKVREVNFWAGMVQW